jgi:uncharacterized membrane protein YdcZ (DUF606 family)
MKIFKRKPKIDNPEFNDGKILVYEALTGDTNKDPEYVVEITQKFPWWGWVVFFLGVAIVFYSYLNY